MKQLHLVPKVIVGEYYDVGQMSLFGTQKKNMRVLEIFDINQTENSHNYFT